MCKFFVYHASSDSSNDDQVVETWFNQANPNTKCSQAHVRHFKELNQVCQIHSDPQDVFHTNCIKDISCCVFATLPDYWAHFILGVPYYSEVTRLTVITSLIWQLFTPCKHTEHLDYILPDVAVYMTPHIHFLMSLW